MKACLLFCFTVLIMLTSCQQKVRYTQDSPEIDTYKKVIADYENRDWENMVKHYADTAKILNNVFLKDAQTLSQLMATNKEDQKLFSSWKYDAKTAEYEMVITDKGETWVNFYGNWQATLISNGKFYEIPAHITAQFKDGKIVQENGYWDLSKLMMDMQPPLASASNKATE
jgi:uncharacterized membrane-anchored protein YhcB (DUF1043 family)